MTWGNTGANTPWSMTFGAVTGNANQFSITDTTGSANTLPLVNINTVGTSTALPLQVTTQGTANGVQVDLAGNLKPIGTGLITGTQVVNAQTGTTYTFVTTDRAKLVTLTNASSIAITLPQAGLLFPSAWYVDVQNRGPGIATITPATSTIDGAASIILQASQGLRITSDGTNYFTQRGSGVGSGSPVYTNVTFSSAPAFVVSGTGPNTFKIILTANVTSSTLTNAASGQQIELDICQDATGGRSFVFPLNVLGAPAIASGVNACTRETFVYDGTNANFNGFGSGTPAYTVVSFSATPVFTASGNGPNGFKIALTGNVTSSTLAGAVAGQQLEFDICQDGTGGRTFVFPANVVNALPIWSAANYCTRETFMFDGTNANFNDATLLTASNTWTLDQRFKSININSSTFASQFTGADICAKIQAALNASAGGWTIADVSGNQTACAGGWTVPAGVTLFLNAASYTVGATIHIPSGAKMIGAGGNPNNGAGTVIAAKNSLNAPVVQLESNSGCSVVNSWHWSEVGWFRIEGNSANNTSATDGILVCASGENAIVHNILVNDTKGAGVHYQGITASTGATRDVSVFSAQNNAFWFDNTTGAYAMESIADDGAPAFIKVAPGNGSFMLSVKKAKNDGGTTTANAPWLLIDGTLSGMQFYGESLQMGTFAAHSDAIQMINGNSSAIVLVNSNAPFASAAGYTNLLNDNGTLIPLQRNFIEGSVSFFAWNGLTVDVQAGNLGFVKKQISLGGGSGTKQDFQAPAPGFGTWNRIYNASGDYGFGGISFGNIGGFNFETDGRLMYLFNDTASSMYFTDEDAGSAAGHRIRTQTGAQVTVPTKGLAQLMYMDKISFIAAAPAGISRASNVVTVTTTGAHNLIVGENVVISGAVGCAGTSPNGTFAVASVPTTTTFTYAQTGTTETCGSGLADYGRWLLTSVWPNAGGGGAPGGANTQIQWNNNGTFAGSANVTYTLATGAVNVSQLANSNDFSRWKRATDTAPTGFVHRLRNAADSVDLYTLDVLGNTVANTGTFTDPTVAGAIGLSQGPTATTAKCPALGPNCILHQAPTAVTPFMIEWPGVAAAGVLQGSISGSGATLKNTLASVIPTSPFELPIGTCTSGTAATSAWDLPSSGTPGTVACVTDGSNVHSKPALNYANSGTPEWWYTLLMPPNLTGNADMNLVWQTATVSGTATFNLDVICQNPNNTADTTAFSAGNFMAPSVQTASSTANNLNLITVTNQAWPASCTSGTLAHFRLKRTDTGTAVTASVVTVQLTLRRTF